MYKIDTTIIGLTLANTTLDTVHKYLAGQINEHEALRIIIGACFTASRNREKGDDKNQ